MGSPITFSGFNQIDFSTILTAVMQQESRPLQSLQQKQTQLKTADTTYGDLAGRLATLRASAQELAGMSTALDSAATTSDSTAVGADATTGAANGRYDVVVSSLARAQVTASSSTAADADTTNVASGGTITIGGVAVTLTGPVTLQGLADAINDTSNVPASASIIQTAPGAFRLVLTANETGQANAFTVTNGLTGTTVAFTDTDLDGTSGDTAADNAVQASNAALTINNIAVTSTTNTLTTGIPGVTLTLSKADPLSTIVIDVSRDDEALTTKVKAFVTAYNDVSKFAVDNLAAAGALGNSAVVRSVRNELRQALSTAHGTGTFTYLAEVGIGFNRTGQLTLNETALKQALQTDADAVRSLFADTDTGVFADTRDLLGQYTAADGFVPTARAQITQELTQVAARIDEMQRRLALRKAALQREYTAADQAMTRLNSQRGSLSSAAAGLTSSQF